MKNKPGHSEGQLLPKGQGIGSQAPQELCLTGLGLGTGSSRQSGTQIISYIHEAKLQSHNGDQAW